MLFLAVFLLFILGASAGHTHLGSLWAGHSPTHTHNICSLGTDILIGGGGGGSGGMSPKCRRSVEGRFSIGSIKAQDLSWCFPIPEISFTLREGHSLGCQALCWSFRVSDSAAVNTERWLSPEVGPHTDLRLRLPHSWAILR